MLEKLGFKKRTHVGIALSSNNLLELICIDKITKTINRYSSCNVKYNTAIKEIIDFEEFKEGLELLFDEAGLDPSACAITMTIPNVHFDITVHENATEDAYISENIQAEIEDLYIFKRNEPQISYSLLPAPGGIKNVVYGAVQTKMVGKISEIFETIGAELVRIEPSYASLLKSLQYNDKYSSLFFKEEQTTVILIGQSSCSAFAMNADTIVDYKEEPLAVRAFSPEEVYSTIGQFIENNIQKNPSKNLLIISETGDVNAELLSQRINYSGELEYINKSPELNDAYMEVDSSLVDIDAVQNSQPFITIEGIGAAVSDFGEYTLDLNFLPNAKTQANIVEINGYEVDFVRFALILFLFAIIIAFLISLIIEWLLGMQAETYALSNVDNQREIAAFRKKIDENSNSSQEDVLKELTNILEQNKKVINVYTALATDIPDSIYIKKFVTNEAGAMAIVGEAKTSESVEKFVTGLREKNDSLMLSKLSMNSSFDKVQGKIPNGFTFEIKSQDKDIEIPDDSVMLQPMMNNSNSIMLEQGNYTPNNGRMMPPPSPII